MRAKLVSDAGGFSLSMIVVDEGDVKRASFVAMLTTN